MRRAGSWSARRPAGRRGWRCSLAPSVDHVVLLHALLRLGAVAAPLDPRAARAELDDRVAGSTAARGRARPGRGRRGRRRRRAPSSVDGTTRGGRLRRSTPPAPSGRPRPVELTYGNSAGARSGRPPGSASRRPTAGCAACRCTTSAGCRSRCAARSSAPRWRSSRSIPSAIAARSPSSRSRSRRWSRRCWRGCWTPGVEPGRPALRAARRRACSRGAGRAGARCGLPGGADLRPHRGGLAGRDAAARRGPRAARVASGPPIFHTEVRIDERGPDLRRGGRASRPASAGADGWLRDRRPRADRRGRLPLRARPRRRRDRHGRRERLARGGRAGAARRIPPSPTRRWRAAPDPEWQTAVVAYVVADGASPSPRTSCAPSAARGSPAQGAEGVRAASRSCRATRQGKLLRRELANRD